EQVGRTPSLLLPLTLRFGSRSSDTNLVTVTGHRTANRNKLFVEVLRPAEPPLSHRFTSRWSADTRCSMESLWKHIQEMVWSRTSTSGRGRTFVDVWFTDSPCDESSFITNVFTPSLRSAGLII
ncbi:hypothetical protein ATANTOWER_000173, partial [Ataeniobius toweri]|nr:hypothetical protein [Ataeniobius toweri]